MGGTVIKVDIGHGRGWLAPAPAASLARIDAQLGRPADINEAGRSPEQANENRRKWLAYERYLNGGPWAPKAPYALGADQSVHCWGYAADTDDSYDPAASAVWERNGWVQTALYPNNLAKHEPWHREYREDRDQHRNDPAPAGAETPTIPVRRDTMSIPPLANTGGDNRIWDVSGGAKRHITKSAEMDVYKKIAEQLDPHGRPGEEAINDYIAKVGGLATIPNRVDAVTVEQVEAIVKRAGVGGTAAIDYEAIADAVNDEAARRLAG